MYALERYTEAVEAAPIDRDLFNMFFIGGLSVKFDYGPDEREWDDALAKASAFAVSTEAARLGSGMSLPPVLASKFVDAKGFYINRTMVDFTASTETSYVLYDGRRFDK